MGAARARQKTPVLATTHARLFKEDLARIVAFGGPDRPPTANVIHRILELAGVPPVEVSA